MQRSMDLRSQHRAHLLQRLIPDIRVPDNAGGVDDAVDLSKTGLALIDQILDVFTVGDIGAQVKYFRA